jgi:hypothetical protein
MPSAAVRVLCARYERLVVLLALLSGAAWRLYWVHAPDRLQPAFHSEARSAALAFARTVAIADAYGPGQGPTAHVTPVMAIYEGLIYRTLGEGAAAEWVLAGGAIGLFTASAYLLYLCMKRLEVPVEWRLAGLLTVCLLPFNAWIELRDLRYFEGLAATAIGAGLLLRVLDLDRRPSLSLVDTAWMGIGAAGLALINPAAALGVYGAIGILMLRRSGWRRWPAQAAVLAAALAVALTPWALRNERVLGHLVILRSNLGLELAQAYYPGAVAPENPRRAFMERHNAIHPTVNPQAFAEVRALGEVAYSDRLGREAEAWAASHPADAARIALRSFRQFWLPDAWMYSPWSAHLIAKDIAKTAFVWVVTLLGFAALATGLLRRDWRYLYVAPALILPSLPYVLTQPVVRYRYLISSLVVFLAFDALRRLADASRPRA